MHITAAGSDGGTTDAAHVHVTAMSVTSPLQSQPLLVQPNAAAHGGHMENAAHVSVTAMFTIRPLQQHQQQQAQHPYGQSQATQMAISQPYFNDDEAVEVPPVQKAAYSDAQHAAPAELHDQAPCDVEQCAGRYSG